MHTCGTNVSLLYPCVLGHAYIINESLIAIAIYMYIYIATSCEQCYSYYSDQGNITGIILHAYYVVLGIKAVHVLNRILLTAKEHIRFNDVGFYQ